MRLIETKGNYKLFDDTEEEYRVDTGNPNYRDVWRDTWFRIYKNGKQVAAFRSVDEARLRLQRLR